MKITITQKITRYMALATLGLLLFSMGGYYVVFGIMQFQAKQTMHSLIAHSTDYRQLGLEKIQFSKNDPGKISADEDEFTYNGKRYDLVYAKTSPDSITLYCIWDRNEEAVVNALQQYQLSNGTTPQQSDQQKTIVNIFKLLNQPAVTENFLFNMQASSSLSTAYFNAYKSLNFISYIKQPPKVS